jgi:predicted O-methyltransferase YrrM
MIYEQFLSNIVHQKLEDYVIPLPQLSRYGLATLRRLNLVADLIHVDAGHEYDSVYADVAASWDLLRPGGCLVAEDFDATWQGVVQAVTDFAQSKQVTVIDRRPKALLWKP